MLSKLMNKTKADDGDKGLAELISRISKMNLTDMRLYVNNKIVGLELSEKGLNEVLKKLTSEDEKSSKRYIEIDDDHSKIKKGFDLVILICESKKISASTVELIQNFIETYSDIIIDYDNKNKQIYVTKLKDSIEKAVERINNISEIKNKMNVLN